MKTDKMFQSLLGLVLIFVLIFSMAACGGTEQASGEPAEDGTETEEPASDEPIIMVWYPNESAADYQPARDEFARLMTEATGRPVEHKLTTDYSIAIEALANGTADICFMGAQGYIEAKNANDAVEPLFVNSGASGTLDDAIYYSWLAVNKGDESNYMENGDYSIANIQGKKISFVSNSSTSGFKVPTSGMLAFFTKTDEWKDLTIDDLVEGGTFFEEVLFGQSHQGSAVNLLTGKADVAAFCDTEAAPYMDLASGEASKKGAVYEVKAGATAPFDTLVGKQCVLIQSTPVLNGPFAFNSESLPAADVEKIRALFTSPEVAANELIFVVPDSGKVGMFKKTDKEQFVLVEDEWFNPIRELS
ncbi:MAG TPA: PhnD/SsuA/transferrin family substrate-binding protein [Anaerovoracaceae bacterium]|nr:PhnD/SsuA/transferrin family substrate-binding protein [Anaerovoracaceae bacterium]